jgi:hypothetical protein
MALQGVAWVSRMYEESCTISPSLTPLDESATARLQAAKTSVLSQDNYFHWDDVIVLLHSKWE